MLVSPLPCSAQCWSVPYSVQHNKVQSLTLFSTTKVSSLPVQHNKGQPLTIFSTTKVSPLLCSVQPRPVPYPVQHNKGQPLNMFSTTKVSPLLCSAQQRSVPYPVQHNKGHSPDAPVIQCLLLKIKHRCQVHIHFTADTH